jgi:hypothetical protein
METAKQRSAIGPIFNYRKTRSPGSSVYGAWAREQRGRLRSASSIHRSIQRFNESLACQSLGDGGTSG